MTWCVCANTYTSVCLSCLSASGTTSHQVFGFRGWFNVRSPNLQGCTASWRVFLIFLLVMLSRCFPGQKPGRELRSVTLSLLASWQSGLRVKNESKSHTCALIQVLCCVSPQCGVLPLPFLSLLPPIPVLFPPFHFWCCHYAGLN